MAWLSSSVSLAPAAKDGPSWDHRGRQGAEDEESGAHPDQGMKPNWGSLERGSAVSDPLAEPVGSEGPLGSRGDPGQHSWAEGLETPIPRTAEPPGVEADPVAELPPSP